MSHSLRPWWRLLIAAALVVVGLVAWAGREGLLRSQDDETWARCQREGVLRVGMDASFPPFEIEEGGSFRGYDVELAQEIGRRLGLRALLLNVHFDGLYDALAAGRCDVLISALPYDPQRTRDVAYTGGYFNAGQVLVTREDGPHLGSAADLAGHRVAVEMGSLAHQVARRLRERDRLALTIEAARTGEEALALVREGRADAAIVDAIAARSALRAQQGLAIRGAPLTDESFVIAVRRDSPRLFAAVSDALNDLRAEGWLEALAARWL